MKYREPGGASLHVPLRDASEGAVREPPVWSRGRREGETPRRHHIVRGRREFVESIPAPGFRLPTPGIWKAVVGDGVLSLPATAVGVECGS